MFERLIQRMDRHSKLLRAWELKGGVSAQVTALEVLLSNGEVRKLVVRQHGPADVARNPHIATDEYKLLKLLADTDVPAPAPYGADESGEILPSPYIAIEFIEGETILSAPTPNQAIDLCNQLAAALAAIHQADISSRDVSYLPKQERRLSEFLARIPADVADMAESSLIREALQRIEPSPPRNKETLLHGDYWPGNMLWKNGRLVAVIDWEDAAIGDPLADLANARLEIAWSFGTEAMHHFTRRYQALMPCLNYTSLPIWDLRAALKPAIHMSGWGLDEDTERGMREKLAWFVKQAANRQG
ncbi:phosphotransferase [Cohnella lubricantis]|uniref:Phosphotransferase n=1 Tax=Cohnella lubricantis TaxID=2163172 RepID=A0A841T7H4_9BACL|nr:phosphotransferase [Cohnella lubricantis]MBB6675905.1 phosphotransferase [Cohnella lubricantis]MBP2117178.1 aminoglycoside phosphotransferase (APT) family kinase protein [Cohnella lubricantis]